jgi:hypothetical protein
VKASSPRTKTNLFHGKWRIVSTNVWDPAALDEFEPAHLTFEPDGTGELCFIAIAASIDYRLTTRGCSPSVEFTWAGDDDGSPISGRGWAQRDPQGLVGQLFIHEGEEAKFVAKRVARLGRAAPRRDVLTYPEWGLSYPLWE